MREREYTLYSLLYNDIQIVRITVCVVVVVVVVVTSANSLFCNFGNFVRWRRPLLWVSLIQTPSLQSTCRWCAWWPYASNGRDVTWTTWKIWCLVGMVFRVVNDFMLSCFFWKENIYLGPLHNEFNKWYRTTNDHGVNAGGLVVSIKCCAWVSRPSPIELVVC